jgi:hypothetical protein
MELKARTTMRLLIGLAGACSDDVKAISSCARRVYETHPCLVPLRCSPSVELLDCRLRRPKHQQQRWWRGQTKARNGRYAFVLSGFDSTADPMGIAHSFKADRLATSPVPRWM